MSFLKSIIHDSGPRKGMGDSFSSPLLREKWGRSLESDGSSSSEEGELSGLPDRMNVMTAPLSASGSSGSVKRSDSVLFHKDRPVKDSAGDKVSNREKKTAASLTLYQQEPFTYEEDISNVIGEVEDMEPAGTSLNVGVGSEHKSSNYDNNSLTRFVDAAVTDEQRSPEKLLNEPDRLTIKHDLRKAASSRFPETDNHLKSDFLETSFEKHALSSDTSENPNQHNEVKTVLRESLLESGFQQKQGPVINEREFLLNGSLPREVSFSGPGEQEHLQSRTGQEEISQPPKTGKGEKKGDNAKIATHQQMYEDSRITSKRALPSVPAIPFQANSLTRENTAPGSGRQLGYAEKKYEAPKVQIGQIDVIIEAAVRPVSKQAPAQAPTDLASRNYLRSL